MIAKFLKSSIIVTGVTAIVMILQLIIANDMSVDKELLSKYVYVDFIILASTSLAIFGCEQGYINLIHENEGVVPLKSLVLSSINFSFLLFPIFIVFSSFSLSIHDYFLMFISGFSIMINQNFVYYLRYNQRYLVSSLCERVFWLFFVILYLLFDVELIVSVALSTLFASTFSIITISFYRQNTKLCFFSKSIRLEDKSIKEGAYITATSYLTMLYERLDQFLISIFISPAVLASYFIVQKLSFLNKFITRSMYQVLYPMLKKSNDIIEMAINTNVMLSFFFSILMIFGGEFFLKIFNVDANEYHLVLILLSISVFISSLNNTLYQFINHKGASNLYFKNSLILVTFQLALVLPLMYFYSYEGIAFSRIIVSSIGAYRACRDFNQVAGSQELSLKPFLIMLTFLFISGGFIEIIN
ncbi:hypothetical protein [Shewanella xiamenensis]|uniref:lipopolysaccharide biosynthesis protein n=1 Tax=Shewanella xiamenensis TaxID=332186 RepID=UPI00313A9A3C